MDWTFRFALWLTVFAWLATGIGSLIALLTKRTNETFLAFALGFSAWVMLYVSFVEILQKWFAALTEGYWNVVWWRYTLAWFFWWIAIIAIIDTIVPKILNPHEPHHVEELHDDKNSTKKNLNKKERKLLTMWIVTAVAIGIHNFPEWFATFIAALEDPSLGIAIAVAIAIHNIPEWIAASVPIYYATWSRMKAFWYSFISGLAEPIGALLGYFLLLQYMSPELMWIIFAWVAWIMVFISLDELLPTAREYGDHHTSMYWVILGMAVMALSLQLFMV